MNARTTAGATPLHDAARRNNALVMKLLIENGALLEPRTCPEKRTPLEVCAGRAHHEAVSILLATGASDTIPREDNMPALTWLLDSFLDGSYELWRILQQKGSRQRYLKTLQVLRAHAAWNRRKHAIAAYYAADITASGAAAGASASSGL